MEQIRNLSITDYHKGEGISASQIKKAIPSTAHFFVEEKKSEKRNPAFDMGNGFELLLTEPENFFNEVVIFNPENKPEADKTMGSKLNKAWKDEIMESDKIVLDLEQFETLQKMVESCKKNNNIVETLRDCKLQMSLFWNDPETGLLLKTRPDVIKYISEKNVIVNDVKTCMDASPDGFGKAFANLNYGIQAVTQIDGVESALGVTVDFYTYTVVEKLAPFNAQVYVLSPEDIVFYRQIYKAILKRIKRAMEDKKYIDAGYSEDSLDNGGALDLSIPAWHTKQLENKFLS